MFSLSEAISDDFPFFFEANPKDVQTTIKNQSKDNVSPASTGSA